MKPLSRKRGRGAVLCALFLGLASLAGTAQSQWAWKDEKGNITYSDAPPPSNIQPSSILRQPAPSAPPPERHGNSEGSVTSAEGYSASRGPDPAQAQSAAEIPRPSTPSAKTLVEQEAEFRKRAADREKAAQKAEQEEAKAAERASACSQAQGYLQMIESGVRLMRPDAEGNRNFMDEEQRAAEVQKAQDAVAKNCG